MNNIDAWNLLIEQKQNVREATRVFLKKNNISENEFKSVRSKFTNLMKKGEYYVKKMS